MPNGNYTNAGYVLPVINSSAGANKYHLGLFNGTTSSYPIYVHRVLVVPHLTAAVTGLLINVLLKRITANGNPQTAAVVRKLSSRWPSVPSGVVGTSSWSANPTEDSNPELAEGVVNSEETVAQSTCTLFEADTVNSIPPIELWPGQGVVIQQGALASAGGISAFIHFRIKKGA